MIKDWDTIYIKVFLNLKTSLIKIFIVVYFNLSHGFHININTSNIFEFNIIIFYNNVNRVYHKEKSSKEVTNK